MKYKLYEGNTKSARDALTEEFEDNFSAERWARNWVGANGKGDNYTLEREDGRLAMSVFRTQSGQWYLTPKLTAEQGAST